jgi:hypothetical protein
VAGGIFFLFFFSFFLFFCFFDSLHRPLDGSETTRKCNAGAQVISGATTSRPIPLYYSGKGYLIEIKCGSHESNSKQFTILAPGDDAPAQPQPQRPATEAFAIDDTKYGMFRCSPTSFLLRFVCNVIIFEARREREHAHVPALLVSNALTVATSCATWYSGRIIDDQETLQLLIHHHPAIKESKRLFGMAG